MRELTRLVAVSEGMDPSLPPSLIWQAAMLKRERRREELQALSLSICAGIGICLGGGDTSRVLRPFYTAKEWSEMEAQTAAMREEFAQRQQLAKIRRLMGDQDGR